MCHYFWISIGFFTESLSHRNKPVLMTTLVFHELVFFVVHPLTVSCTIFSTGPYHLLAK